MREFLRKIDWPATFAIVGVVVAALFGNLLAAIMWLVGSVGGYVAGTREGYYGATRVFNAVLDKLTAEEADVNEG